MSCRCGIWILFLHCHLPVRGYQGSYASESSCSWTVEALHGRGRQDCVQVKNHSTLIHFDPDGFSPKILVTRQDGISGFFRGLPALWGRDIPFYFVFFASYQLYISSVISLSGNNVEKDQLSPLHFIMGGGLAGSAAWAIVFPLDVIKVRGAGHACGAFCLH